MALNAIAADQPGPVDAVVQVAIYDALWFLVPIASLVLAVVRPERGRRVSRRGDGVGPSSRAHHRRVGSFVLGAYLVVKGAAGLLT